jgi:hypothetical protein
MTVLLKWPSQTESFPTCPNRQRRGRWRGYVDYMGDDAGRWDGIETPALTRLGRVWSVGGPHCVYHGPKASYSMIQHAVPRR